MAPLVAQKRLASSRRFPSNGEPRTSGVSFALARLGHGVVVMPRRVEAGGQPNLGCVTKDMGLARSTEISGFQMVMTSGHYVVKSRLGWHIDLCQEARKMTQPSESLCTLGTSQKPHSTSDIAADYCQIYLSFAARSGWREATRQTSTF